MVSFMIEPIRHTRLCVPAQPLTQVFDLLTTFSARSALTLHNMCSVVLYQDTAVQIMVNTTFLNENTTRKDKSSFSTSERGTQSGTLDSTNGKTELAISKTAMKFHQVAMLQPALG